MSLLDESAPDAVRATEIPLRRNRDFLLLWIGAGVSMLGLRASVVAYPLLMLWYGNSPIGAGLVGFAVLLPQLVVQLPAGALVDRWDRRRLLIGCDIAGLLAMGAVVVMLAAGRLWLPALMVAAFIDGSRGCATGWASGRPSAISCRRRSCRRRWGRTRLAARRRVCWASRRAADCSRWAPGCRSASPPDLISSPW